MSPTRDTSLYLSNINVGMANMATLTELPFLLTVFPYKQPISGPKICSAAMISALVIGQFGN
eukprot:13739802-Ditylum_brightwellii.AAC.1